jgi:putative ABC transport system permease protein
VEFRSATPGYLETLGLALLRGRGLEPRDDREAPAVALVNETLARDGWPGADPVGHSITMFGDTFTVVGVVGDAHQLALDRGTAPEMMVPYAQVPRRYMTVVLRTAGEHPDLAQAIIRRVAVADPEVPVERLRTAAEYLDRSLTAPRFRTGVVALLGAVALVLAAVGVYGVASYGVRSRVHEIGVRMALGAERRAVLRWVVGRGMVLVGIGLLLGAPLALGVTYLLRHLLFGIVPLDPTTLVLTPAVLIGAALIALTIPGARAAAVDPVVTLRSS